MMEPVITPKISIIVPVYNVEDKLRRCLDSIRGQTYTNYECIMVDDGSADTSGQICDEYAQKYHNFSVIHKENGGLSSARNQAIPLAKGDHLSFVDSDDEIHPRFLELMISTLEYFDVDLVSAPLEVYSSAYADFKKIGKVPAEILEQADFIDNLLPVNFGKICVTACGKLYRREIFANIRYPEEKIHEDLHVYLDVLLSCRRIAVLSEPLYYYYVNPSSITRSNYLKHDRFGEFQVREQYIQFFRERGLEEQMLLAQNDYLTFFLRNAFAVKIRYPQCRMALKPELTIFRGHLNQILKNPYICRMRKICAAGILIAPRLMYVLAKRTIPDCLLDEMR